MAKKSKIAKNDQRRRVVEKHRERREALKATIASPHTTSGARAAAVSALARLPRDSSPTRIRNRDAVDGRPRAFNRTFGLSRINLRQMAHRGELPGVVKSSW